MKKLILGLIAALSVVLTGCSAFDSEPVEPKIIGSGNVQYDAVEGIWFTEIGTTRYALTKVTIPANNSRKIGKTQDVEPVEGMVVTLFTSPRKNGIQAVTGQQSVEQIEELYRTNSTVAVILLSLLLLCVLGIALPNTKKIPVVHADAED